MAFVPLNIAPQWRPWRQAGVTHLLLAPAVLEQLRAESPSRAPGGVVPSRAPAQGGAIRHSAPQTDASSASFVRRDVPVGSGSPHLETALPPKVSSEASRAATQPPSVATTRPDPSSWPAAWKELLRRCGSPQPRVLWTYPGLTEDLGGNADIGRRNFFRRLFRDLSMPKGSHAFWPLRPPLDPEGDADASFFYSGMAVLNPDSVILLCDEAPAVLSVPRLRPFQALIHQGRRFVQLHDPTELARELDSSSAPSPRYARLLGFLRAFCT